MKGQFFLVGGILLALFLFVMFSAKPQFSTRSDDLTFFMDNIERELPRALNLGINNSFGDPTATLTNFTQFLKSTSTARLSNLTIIWIVTTPHPTVNLTVGNFMDEPLNITVSLTGASSQTMSVGGTNLTSTTFSGVPQSYNATISFSGQTYHATGLNRNKFNLFAFIRVSRIGDRLISTITA